jgi:SMC interacting uncharacterized protein involved in chromosome segregation
MTKQTNKMPVTIVSANEYQVLWLEATSELVAQSAEIRRLERELSQARTKMSEIIDRVAQVEIGG